MKKPYVVPLPPEVVNLLEAKHKGSLNRATDPSWLALKSHLQETLERMTKLSSHDAQDATLDQAREHLEAFETGLGGVTDLESLTQAAFKLFGALNEYVRIRDRLNVCSLPEINSAVHTIQALKRGRLDWSEAEQAREELVSRVDDLVVLFKNGGDHLPSEIQQALLKGFDAMNLAVSQWNARDLTKVDEISANLAGAGTILEHLDKWQKEFEAENTCEVPVVGREIKEMLVELENSGALSDATLDKWYDDVGPRLQEFWGPARHDFFTTRAHKDRLVVRIDTRIYELGELENMTPQQQYDGLRDLVDAFIEIPTRTFQRDVFENHPQPWLFDTFSAILAKGVPRYQLEWMVDEMTGHSDSYELGVLLQSYLQSDDRDFILDALEVLEKESERNYKL